MSTTVAEPGPAPQTANPQHGGAAPRSQDEPRALSMAKLALAGILLSALGGAGLGMAMFMWNMGSDMTNMTVAVAQMGKDVTRMSADVGTMTGRTQVMAHSMVTGQAQMGGDLNAIRGGMDFMTGAMGGMGRDMHGMGQSIDTMTGSVGEMTRAIQQMAILIASMDGSMAMIRDTMHRITFDLRKMVEPGRIMTPFR